MKNNNVLALDPAEKFGWAVSRDLYGVWDFKLKRDESFSMKLVRFRSRLTKLVEEAEIDYIVFERVSGRFSGAIASHSKFVAVIELFCEDNEIPYKGYSAKEVKKFATGNGNAGKPKMIANAKAKLKYKGDDDNEADALWILELAKYDLGL